MITSTPAHSAALLACIGEMSRLSPFLIDRWSSRLAVAMYERSLNGSEPAERHQLQDAIAALKKNRPVIEQGFPERLTKAVADEMLLIASGVKLNKAGRPLSSVRFDDLELMGDTQVQQAVENARLHQLVRQGCESALAGFSARLSTAQGFLTVKGDNNPLRPEIMALALSQLLQSLPISTQTRACWLLDGALIMGEELQSLYLSLNEFLAGQGIEPAAYGVTGMLSAQAAGKASRSIPFKVLDHTHSVMTSPDQESDQFVNRRSDNRADTPAYKPLLTLDHLHHLLMGDYENSSYEVSSFSEFAADEMVRQDFSHTVPTAMDALNDLKKQGLFSANVKLTRHAPPSPVADLRARFKTHAKTLGQSLAIEVVGLMIEQIANDARLLPAVRQIVANAEPAFLQLAVTDPRFFSDRSHPARRLLEAITSASLGYAGESAPGFSEFLQHLQEVAALLDVNHANDAEHFAQLLEDFERRQNRDTLENRKAQRLAVQTLLQAEKRNLMAVKIALEIRARPDFIDSSQTITGFLTGPWALVMARERLAEQGVTLGDCMSVFSLAMDDLLWSLDTNQAARHRQRLVKMIPGLLQLLRQGLASINFPIEQSRPFFDQLMTRHQDALKLLQDPPAAEPKNSHSLEEMFAQSDHANTASLWLAPAEIQNSGFMRGPDEGKPDGVVENLLEPQATATGPLSTPSVEDEQLELSLGDWVDLLVDINWLRAQLTWVSPENTLFMFTSQGGRKHSMTLRMLRQLTKLGQLKVVCQQGVVEGALDSVARTALQNSVLDNTRPNP